ncbi:MAG: hypothetical protein ACE15C_00865 [Phycisphaerae bacterium]
MRRVISLGLPALLLAAIFAAGGCDGAGGWTGMGSLGAIGGTNNGDEEYTIGLTAYIGKDHNEKAQYLEAQTRQQTGWKNVYAIHKEFRSELYVGRYRTEEEATADMKRVKRWRDSTGTVPFPDPAVVEMPGVEPGPPQWNLKKVPGEYSVVVAVFKPQTDLQFVPRRKLAVEYCKELRGKGEEAYYYHGPVESSVCVGLFGKDAIGEQYVNGAWQPVIQDKRINAIMQKHPYLAVNGGIYPMKTMGVSPEGKPVIKEIKPPTYPFRIPREGALPEPPRATRSYAPTSLPTGIRR